MADDGLLLNFSISDAPLSTKPIFKGGRWRDRLKAKKSLYRNTAEPGTLTGSNAIPTKPRILAPPDTESRPAKKVKPNPTQSQNPNGSKQSKEVVSSLFTSNPTSKAQAPKETEEDIVLAPSNAPLPDGVSPFTSLGLSPKLASHLLTTLNLTAPTAIQKAAISQLLKEDSDAFIQAETGSGKTLAYLLPVLQRIMALSASHTTETGQEENRPVDRTSGLFALILAPTRELTHQISLVLTQLLNRMPCKIVPGTVTGGATKNHEKARLRKGLNILVATPGRLVDHLENTEVLDVSQVRWLVLDEGDRLMELGFGDDIEKIIRALEEKRARKWDKKAKREGVESYGTGERDFEVPRRVFGLPERRTTVLCSATMKMGVQKLGEISLKDAVLIKADPTQSSAPESPVKAVNAINGAQQKDQSTTSPTHEPPAEENPAPFLAPSQLKQSYVLAPAKQRLVTLAAYLKRSFARKGSVMKAIVFLSCADSVDYHFQVFARQLSEAQQQAQDGGGGSSLTQETTNLSIRSTKRKNSTNGDGKHNHQDRNDPATTSLPPIPKPTPKPAPLPTTAPSPTLSTPSNPTITLYKLHGSLPQSLRSATLAALSKSPHPSILFSTDVASRGLDLPDIDLVIEYDPAFSSDEHLHRVGRTARAGREGRAVCFVLPGGEEGYVDVLRRGVGGVGGRVKGEGGEEVLRKGFGGGGGRWDERATEWQLGVERWVVENSSVAESARKAFVSHVRAYATHVVREREIFDVKDLHLGHLAKGFALRERPGGMGRSSLLSSSAAAAGGKNGKIGGRGEKRRRVSGGVAGGDGGGGVKIAAAGGEGYENVDKGWRGDTVAVDGADAARRMRKKMREHMAAAGEFNIG